MARRQFKGAASSKLLSGAISSSALAVVLTTDPGASWPDGSTGKFIISIDRGLSTEEKILCDSRSGATITVNSSGRGYDGTTGVGHSSGVTVEHVMGAVDLDEPNAHINTTSQDDHTQYLKTDGTRAPTGITNIAAIPGSSAPGDVASKGTGPTLALSDHVHGREAAQAHTLTGGYAQVTADQTGITSVVDLTGLTATVTVASGRRIKVTGVCDGENATSGLGFVLGIYEGATQLNDCARRLSVGGVDETFMAIWVGTPSAGSHTYKLRGTAYGGGTAAMRADATAPAFILVEDIVT